MKLHDEHIWGSSGRTIVLLHGFPDEPAGWARVGTILSRQGYQVVAPFLPGYEQRLEGSADLLSITRTVSSFVKQYPEDTVIVGHDWGAAIGYMLVNLGLTNQVLTMSVPPMRAFLRSLPRGQIKRSRYMLDFQFKNGIRRSLDAVDRLERLWSDWGPNNLDVPSSIIQRLTTPERGWSQRGIDAIAYYKALLGQNVALRDYRATAEVALSPLRKPVAMAIGSDDGCIARSAYDGWCHCFDTRIAREASLSVIKNTGHFAQYEQPELVAEWILGAIRN